MSYQNAVEELRSFSNKFKNIISVSEFLEKIGSLDQAEKDAIIRKDVAYQAEAEAKVKLSVAQNKIDVALAEVAKANAEKDRLVDLGNQKSKEMIEDAQKRSAALIKEATDKLKLAHEEASKVKKQADEVSAQIQLKRDEYFGLQKQLEGLKAKISDFIK